MAARRGKPVADLPSAHLARGTYKPSRHGNTIEFTEPDSLPQRPDWLTEEGGEVWLDDVGRVSAHRLVTEKDAMAFAQYCNLMGACIKAWRAGSVPPVTAIAETRKMAELFGICGARSRVKVAQMGEAGANPFTRNGRRGAQ
jgi:hypothetical protein